MMLVFFCLFMLCFGMESDGVWSVLYFSEKGCIGTQFATRLTDKCVVMPELTGSFHYTCSNVSPKNVTVDVYHTDSCEKEGPVILSSHIGTSEICNKVESEGFETFQEWYCLSDYGVNYPYLLVSVPLYLNDSDIGTVKNPVVGQGFQPLVKCMKIGDEGSYHVTITCDVKTQLGIVKAYEGGECIIPIYHREVKKGDIMDFTRLHRKPVVHVYMRYEGCKV